MEKTWYCNCDRSWSNDFDQGLVEGTGSVCAVCGYYKWTLKGEDTKGEDTMEEYTIIKEITGRQVMLAGACEQELDKFVRVYGFNTELTQFDILDIVSEHPDWIDWLVNNRFLEERKQITLTMDYNLATYIWHRLNCGSTKPYQDYDDERPGQCKESTYKMWAEYSKLFSPIK